MTDILVAPSLLAADYLRLDSEMDSVIASGADVLHYDVMDGEFVPAITFGQGLLGRLAEKGLPIDAHLMIAHPERHIDEFADAGASYITVHQEAAGFALPDTLRRIRARGCKAGVSVKPYTSVESVYDVLPEVDLVLIMTVEPGKGGQKLIPFTVDKVRQLKDMCRKLGVFPRIEVDGGVNLETASLVKEAGADMLVAGSAFFKATDRKAFVEALKK